ncbi:MAG TPA: hypothetical protein VKA31_10115 [Mariprofundaceae bacterium]|nr:hypothetical protein [Mariprofundaceae bacterium]
MLKKLFIVFAAGCLGGMANSLAVWSFGEFGIAHMAGVSIAPALTPAWLYPRIVWGGLWGFLFLLPMLANRPVSRGLVLSLFPTLIQLFVVFPYKAHKGMAGLELGLLTPLFVIFFNAIWGIVTAYAVKRAGKGI